MVCPNTITAAEFHMSLDFFLSPLKFVKHILPLVTNKSGKFIYVYLFYSIFHSSPVYIIEGKKLIDAISVKRDSP
jgi:hypothetical protein